MRIALDTAGPLATRGEVLCYLRGEIARVGFENSICILIHIIVLTKSHIADRLMIRHNGSFIWDPAKESANIHKHGVDFAAAARPFKDVRRKIYTDARHSAREERFFCIGKVGDRVLTVRFTYRGGLIRIIGAGYWRKGTRYYEKEHDRPE